MPEQDVTRAISAYPSDCQPRSVESLGGAGGYSGTRLWRLETPRGRLCLRRWPKEHPSSERLEFIQRVLWHVNDCGFTLAPAPIRLSDGEGFLRLSGYHWELTPWAPGSHDEGRPPTDERLQAAFAALAQFHATTASFPLAEPALGPSPGIIERRNLLRAMLDGGIELFVRAIDDDVWPQGAERARRMISLFWGAVYAPRQLSIGDDLEAAAALPVRIQPCQRDIWREHVLFEGNQVSGIIDFGAMRPDNVATDLARLLGSLAADDERARSLSLAAYEALRPLSDTERRLVETFHRANVLLGGLQWIEWIFVDGREFDDRARVLTRMDENLARLEFLARGES